MDEPELAAMEMGMAPWQSRAHTGEKHHAKKQKYTALSATEKGTKENLPWTLNLNASSAVNIGTTDRLIKNIHGTESAAAANLAQLAAGAAKLWQQAALHNQAACWSKNIALKIQILLAAHLKIDAN